MQSALAVLVLLLLVSLHLWWRRRFLRAETQSRARIEGLQRQQTRAAEQFNAQQHALFNSMAEGVLLLDEHGRVQLANRALMEMFGFADEPHGKTLLETLRLHELAELYDRVRRLGGVQACELQIAGLDERWICVNASAIGGREGESRGAILVFHDLTQLKRLEKTREEFVANVSHELRTPLSMIKGYVETLLDGAKNDPATTDKFLRTIERHSTRLGLLIEDLLTISQLESGRIQLNRRSIPLRELTGRVLEDFAQRAAMRRMTLSNDVTEMTAHADPERIQQVLSNLVDNAIKYGRPDGHVNIKSRLSENEVELCVRDDGPGIARESLVRVFERFYRTDKARSREQGGTGLGLAIVKHIVQAHGGTVWAESEPGNGAAFFFTLPEAPSQPENMMRKKNGASEGT